MDSKKQTPLDDLIRSELRNSGGNLRIVARRLDINLDALRLRYPQPGGFSPTTATEPEDIKTLGKPGLQQFVIAVKKRGDGWPEKYREVIARGRRAYNNGTHEMCQGHTGGWAVLYLIPRLRKTRQRWFFE